MTDHPKFLVRMDGSCGTFEAIVDKGRSIEYIHSMDMRGPIRMPGRREIVLKAVNVFWHDTGDDVELKLEHPMSSILQLIRNIDLPPWAWEWVISCKVVEEL
jgi:hypothetical protein